MQKSPISSSCRRIIAIGIFLAVCLTPTFAYQSMTPVFANTVITDCSDFSNQNAQYLLQNGSFEQDYFPTANSTTTATLASISDRSTSGGNASNNNGQWLKYGTPNMFLFMRDATASNANRIPFWQAEQVSNGNETFIEIQRQVAGYEQDGTHVGSAYWDNYGVRAAQGSYWAELNAEQQTRLYQDITTVGGQKITYSVKHRGRYFGSGYTSNGTTPAFTSTSTDTSDKFKIYIGAPGSVTAQTPTSRFAPDVIWNTADATYPSTGSSFTGNNGDAARIYTTLNEGWVMYVGTYTVPSGQTTTRFQFQSEGTGTVGNFIDDIRFDPIIACPRSITIAAGPATNFNYSPLVDSQIPGYTYPNTTVLDAVTVASGTGNATLSGNNIVLQRDTAGSYTANFTIEDVNDQQSTSVLTVNVEAVDLNVPDVFVLDPQATTLDFPALTLTDSTNAMLCIAEVDNAAGDALSGTSGIEVTDTLVNGITEQNATNLWTYRGSRADLQTQTSQIQITGVSGNPIVESGSRFIRLSVTAAIDFGTDGCNSGVRQVVELRALGLNTEVSRNISIRS